MWPWDATKAVGAVIPVTDLASAKEAIDVIISQGEGASILNPDQIGSDTLAHFFKFEEIVCQRRLEKMDDLNYAYKGAAIPFNPEGVLPMHSNPTASTTPPDSNCYHKSRIFHRVYRNLLQKLQEVFSGHPDDIFVTIQLMESLLVHAKKLMRTMVDPSDPENSTTCGPVWDYLWPEDQH